MKMELIQGSETSAIRTQTPGNYPKENILQKESTSGTAEAHREDGYCVVLQAIYASNVHSNM